MADSALETWATPTKPRGKGVDPAYVDQAQATPTGTPRPRTDRAPPGGTGRRTIGTPVTDRPEPEEVIELTRSVTPAGPDMRGHSGRPLREDPESQVHVSTQGSTPPLAAHPPGGPAIGTRA
ncbi:hypothetical protein TNCT1_45770 [Streptomyces sp. 1-11]|nr:hypothetical protein TNCT1_45770 [Streptomyces sp. 1-11]